MLRALLILTLPLVAAPAVLSDYGLERYNGRVVIVDFWASWCKPCRQSMPWLDELSTRYAGHGLVVVGINVDAERADAEKFLRDVPVTFEVFFDPAGSLAQRFKVPGMPATYIFDREGVLAESHLGFKQAQRSTFEARVRELLASAANH